MATAFRQINERDLDNWFATHNPSPEEARRMQAVRDQAKSLARTILGNVPAGLDQTAAIRQLREAVSSACAAILYEQI